MEQELENMAEEHLKENLEEPSTSYSMVTTDRETNDESEFKKNEDFKFLDDVVLEELYNIWNNYSEMFQNTDSEEQSTPSNKTPTSVDCDLVADHKQIKRQTWTFIPKNLLKNNVCRHMSPLVQVEVFGQYAIPDICFNCDYKFSSNNSKYY